MSGSMSSTRASYSCSRDLSSKSPGPVYGTYLWLDTVRSLDVGCAGAYKTCLGSKTPWFKSLKQQELQVMSDWWYLGAEASRVCPGLHRFREPQQLGLQPCHPPTPALLSWCSIRWRRVPSDSHTRDTGRTRSRVSQGGAQAMPSLCSGSLMHSCTIQLMQHLSRRHSSSSSPSNKNPLTMAGNSSTTSLMTCTWCV